MIRDLVGYGDEWPDFRWPSGSRLAVSVVMNLEGILAKLDRRRDRPWPVRRIEIARTFAEAVS